MTSFTLTSRAFPSFPMPAPFKTKGTEAPFSSFNATGSDTASRQEMTSGSSPFTSTHCVPADGSQSWGSTSK